MTDFLELLNKKLKPATGCTEPVAIALAGAVAAHNNRGGSIKNIVVRASANIIKNAMAVMLPKVRQSGIDLAAVLGVLSKDSHNKGLEVLDGVDEEMIEEARKIIGDGRVRIELADTARKLYIELVLETDKETTKVVIVDDHTNITRIERNGKLLFIMEEDSDDGEGVLKYEKYNLDDILEFINKVDVKDLKRIEESIELNRKISEEGLERAYGLETGRTQLDNIKKGYYKDDLQKTASYRTSAGSDARMGGATMAVMSNSGSGNQGIVATMPVLAVGERIAADQEKILKAIALSHLVTIYIKEGFGVLSALCGASAAAIGASCGIAYILGGDRKAIGRTINNMVGNVTGMICDGAKPGCALKVAQVTGAAVDAALLALKGHVIGGQEGIVTDDPDSTLENFTRLSREASTLLDKIILEEMLNKKEGD